MSGRASLRPSSGLRAFFVSPTAIGWTLVAVVAVEAVVLAGWLLAAVLSTSPFVTSAILGDLGPIVVSLVVALAAIAGVAAVWLPCAGAIAYAVGRRVRGQHVSLVASVGVVRSRSEPLYRWSKTRIATGPLADRILTEHDVSPAEVAVGSDAFVVPALVLDSATLSGAVERANRVMPRPGRRRIQLGGLGGTAILAVAGWTVGTLLSSVPADAAFPILLAVSPTGAIVVAAVLAGLVATATLDLAWRAGVYAAADPDGFGR